MYVLVANNMLRVEVSSVVKDGISVGFKFGGTGIDDALVTPNKSEAKNCGKMFYINKDTALSNYKKSMSETIIHMSETIAIFSK